jgi:hypothetical protein
MRRRRCQRIPLSHAAVRQVPGDLTKEADGQLLGVLVPVHLSRTGDQHDPRPGALAVGQGQRAGQMKGSRLKAEV